MTWTDSRLLFAGLVAAVATLRLLELRISRRNFRALVARGGVEHGGSHYPWMVALHTGWLVAAPAEVWLAHRPLLPPLAVAMLLLLAAGTALRMWAIASLGGRWCTRVVVVPGLPLVNGGPYRWFRHPNYLGVMLEMVALPLVHSAWITAAAFGGANCLLLRRRIAVEERALRAGRQEEVRGGGGFPQG